MEAMDKNLSSEMFRWQEKLFKHSVRRQMRLRKIKQFLGTLSRQRCLEITSGDGMISARLRDVGGVWTTMTMDSEAQASLRYFIPGEIPVLRDIKIDVADSTYDVVVIIDALERVYDDHAFVKECHRILKSDGCLILTTARKAGLCLISCPLRSMLRLSWRAKGLAHSGYKSDEFFDLLKDGFDVPETSTYSTCCVEMPGLFCEAIANWITGEPYNMPPENAGTEKFYHYTKLNMFATLIYPLMWGLAKIEKSILFFMPGHNIAAKTKRRVWSVRKSPVLIDGRSIAEAAINTKIGTAAPF